LIRDLELAFVKIHILYHAAKEEVFGIGLTEELARHGYKVSPGTLYPTLAKLEKAGFLTCEARTVDHKQRKYYRITPEGGLLLEMMKNKIIELYKEVIVGK
jgi:PadR family transcriptional regulator PadR